MKITKIVEYIWAFVFFTFSSFFLYVSSEYLFALYLYNQFDTNGMVESCLTGMISVSFCGVIYSFYLILKKPDTEEAANGYYTE